MFAAEENASVTKMDASNLVMVMAPNGLRCDSEDPGASFLLRCCVKSDVRISQCVLCTSKSTSSHELKMSVSGCVHVPIRTGMCVSVQVFVLIYIYIYVCVCVCVCRCV